MISGLMLTVYSAAHFWVDLSCALLILDRLGGSGELALCLLLYNFCAFALQMPLGLLADRLNRNGAVAAAGCALVAAAWLLPAGLPLAVAAGVGNALFHLGGGIDILNDSEEKARALGIFVSPGAFGLFFGSMWAANGGRGNLLAPAALLFLAAAILWVSIRRFGSLRSRNELPEISFSGRVLPAACLFLIVVLRSYMGMNQEFAWKGEGLWPWFLTGALVLGKAAGGFCMDRVGVSKAAVLSLLPAAGAYLFSASPLPGTAAVFLFNMTMPVTLWAMVRLFPGAKGFAFGLLTFGLFLGYLPTCLGWPGLLTGPGAYAAVAVLSMLLLWWAAGKAVKIC